MMKPVLVKELKVRNYTAEAVRGRHVLPDGIKPTQRIYLFPNGYGASVIRTNYSHGGDRGLWEIAVVEQIDATKANPKWPHDYDICYDTPITNDVVGHLSDEEVDDVLAKIEALPAWRGGA